jgi:hypothetical protein
MATRNIPPVTKQAVIVCTNAPTAVELVSTAPKSVSSARPLSSLTIDPTGCCIHAFAARMKYAERTVPIEASQMQARCTRFGSRSQPKIHSPRKVDSRKKASRPSIASGAPKMSPTKRE